MIDGLLLLFLGGLIWQNRCILAEVTDIRRALDKLDGKTEAGENNES